VKYYYDTGVLLKLYTLEPESPSVQGFVVAAGVAIPFLDLHRTECSSALHLKAFRGECSLGQSNQALADIDEDLRREVLLSIDVDWKEVWGRTTELVQAHSAITGCRTLDTLHVAAAVTLGYRHFVTSDSRQTALAKRLGLSVIDPTL